MTRKLLELIQMTCAATLDDDGSVMIVDSDIKVYTPEEGIEFILGEIEALKVCNLHDHKLDIERLERFKKTLLADLQETWN